MYYGHVNSIQHPGNTVRFALWSLHNGLCGYVANDFAQCEHGKDTDTHFSHGTTFAQLNAMNHEHFEYLQEWVPPISYMAHEYERDPIRMRRDKFTSWSPGEWTIHPADNDRIHNVGVDAVISPEAMDVPNGQIKWTQADDVPDRHFIYPWNLPVQLVLHRLPEGTPVTIMSTRASDWSHT